MVTTSASDSDEFERLHRQFLQHFALAACFAWGTAVYAALNAPWVHNIVAFSIRPPAWRARGRSCFGLPILLSVGWVCALFGADAIRRSRILKSQSLEFALAGLMAFTVFVMSIERSVAAIMLAR
jgi:hypothetical protein